MFFWFLLKDIIFNFERIINRNNMKKIWVI